MNYNELPEEEKQRYANRLAKLIAGTVDPFLNTDEEGLASIINDIRKIGSSDLINRISEAKDPDAGNTRFFPKGLRERITDEFMGADEDRFLRALGYASDDKVGDSVDVTAFKKKGVDPTKSDYSILGATGNFLGEYTRSGETSGLGGGDIPSSIALPKVIKKAIQDKSAPAPESAPAPTKGLPQSVLNTIYGGKPPYQKDEKNPFMETKKTEDLQVGPRDNPIKISGGLPQSVLNTIYGGKAPYQKDGENPFTETKEPKETKETKEPQIGPTQALAKTIKKTVAANASGGGAATGSGSKAGLGYLRSREDMMARDKSVKAAMADEKKERRQMAEDRFAMRRGDILARQAERAKMEQEKKEANEIKSEAGNLLGRVIRDSSGKVVGTSTTKAGRKALGDDYKGAGGGTYDFSKPADSFEELFARDAVKDQMSSRQRQVMDLMNKRASAPLEEAKKREQPFKEGLALNPSIVDAMQKPPSASDQTPLNVPTLNLNPPPERGSREFRDQSVGDRRSQIASADVVGSNITPSTNLNQTQDIPRGVTNTPPPITQESSKIQAEKRKEALEKAKREREQRKLLEQTQQSDKYSRTA